ncbi:AraC family transcriptional regulator [Pseudonocardia sp. EC080610-09]|uniref:AlkA N-terminal domain-containing protein n=1 Tax=unclassified Pseudonocardia TaxID=2619320 RepID=UPI0006CB7E97|nr:MULTISPECIES: AlkA N-terminal domain-containing protein [unclassified Pseudonocardia]ALE76577.1 AraC family transcriptional regulator [Pseudonocardia sp. EC080625-04]ALL78256.1 AraC family transcriptional regulator [Pseudonocardia sp. EC080610-09]ALL84456.1 AraC family transcriptional regulator [Pseudonocardia sp. EC080619-01]
MLLDHDTCYRAVAAKDQRFDGQFVTAVRTTGIYCRPSCPVPPPKARNVEFLRTAAAAQSAGYRACRRCLPDAVPGSPEWNLRADAAGRAMRLIADGVVEREGVPGLASRLGYSPRQLGRILTAELGAGPLALARAQRAHTARVLVETTPLGLADVAFAAGFGSVRQFNDTVRGVYGVPPSRLRSEAARRRGAAHAAPGTITLRLPYRAPFDPHGLLDHLAARAVDRVERVDGGTYRRTLRLPHGPASVALDLTARPGAVLATLRTTDPRDVGPAVSRLRRLLDLDADPLAVDTALAADPVLAPLVAATPGIRLAGTADPAETAVRTVLGQQVSVAAARTAASRIAASHGTELPPALRDDDGPDLLFPAPETLADVELAGPARRAASLRGLCSALASGELVLDAGREPDALRAELRTLPGIGPWSAGYLAMRVLGDPDELLASDLAVRRGAAALGLPGEEDALTGRARAWAPWRSYAATHLWRAATSAPAVRRNA